MTVQPTHWIQLFSGSEEKGILPLRILEGECIGLLKEKIAEKAKLACAAHELKVYKPGTRLPYSTGY